MDHEEVKEPKYEIIPKVEEANREEVEDFLEVLTNDDNADIIYSRLKNLTALSCNKRFVHYPNVIQKIEGFIGRKIIVDNIRNLDQFFELLNALLCYEKDHKGFHWVGVVERLVTATIEKATNLLMQNPNDKIIECLGRTNRKCAVDTIFEVMRQHSIEAGKNEFYSIVRALARLYDNYSDRINERLILFLETKTNDLMN